MLKRWNKLFSKDNTYIFKYVTNKKQIRFPEDYSRNELIEIVKIQQEIIKEKIGKIKKNDIKDKCSECCISIRKLLYILELSRSTFYDKRSKQELINIHLEDKLFEKILYIWRLSNKNYGYRKIYHSLRKIEAWKNVNHKRIQNICHKYNIKSLIKRKLKRYDPKNQKWGI